MGAIREYDFPDLFSTASDGKSSSHQPDEPPPRLTNCAAAARGPRHVLPKDLPSAIKALSDQELDELSAAVSVEQQRRGGNRHQMRTQRNGVSKKLCLR
jgi:hypothetical protein